MNFAQRSKISWHICRAACFVTLSLTAAQAATPSPKDAIEARQAGYKQMGEAMKALRAQLASAAPDKDLMVKAAQTIATIVPQQAALFPAGSGPEAGLQTDALPNIWTDRATFDARMSDLATEARTLVMTVQAGDPAAIASQVKATGATCGGCHRLFRAEH